LLEAEKKFRRVKGYRELERLESKLNPSLTQKVQVRIPGDGDQRFLPIVIAIPG